MRLHHELRVWQDAVALVRRVYKLSKQFSADERFGLPAQIRQCAVPSLPRSPDSCDRKLTPHERRSRGLTRLRSGRPDAAG
jgi:four helix bundle protein